MHRLAREVDHHQRSADGSRSSRREPWFTSSYSNENNAGACVSVAELPERIGVRDSKQRNGPAFLIPRPALASFLQGPARPQ
nr:DUF397 domain-containing protein [Streptomyces caatingaensis]